MITFSTNAGGGHKLKKAHQIRLMVGATIATAALASTMATPAFAEPKAPAPSTTVTISADQGTPPLTPEQQALAVHVTALTSAVDPETLIFDERALPPALLGSELVQGFATEFVADGGTVISADGTTSKSSSASTVGVITDASARAAAGGRIWQDVWGAHITVPTDTMDRLSTLAATGSGAAGAVAALLAVNIEGFPISTTGALASGAVALSLIAISGALQVCNIHGNGAQVNFNWVMWTCWPL